jgi:hypothetical protein
MTAPMAQIEMIWNKRIQGHPLADPVKWQTHAPAPQERTFSPSRLHSPSSNSLRTGFSKYWLRRSAPVTHQDQGFELGV